MPLFSNDQIATNSAPMVNTSENSKMRLSPPRSPQLGSGLVGMASGVHRPVPTKMQMNQLYGGMSGSASKTLPDPMYLPSADFYPSNTAPTGSDWDMLTLMRAKAKLAQMQHLSQQSSFAGHGIGFGAPLSASLQGELSTSLGSKRSLGEAASTTQSHEDDGSESGEPKGKRRKKGKKPNDMPRRALSAYNIFFSEQRELILKDIERKETGKESEADSEQKDEVPSVLNRTFFPKRTKRAHRKVHGKIGLVSLARTVSQRWKDLSDEKRKYYQDLADEDKKRHKKAMSEYQERKAAESMLSINTNQGGKDQMLHHQGNLMEGMGAGAGAGMSSQQYQQRLFAELMMARQAQQQQLTGSHSHEDAMAFRNLQQMMSQRMTSQSRNFGGQLNGGFGLPPSMF